MFRNGKHEKAMNTMDKILLLIGIFLLAFVVVMIRMFDTHGAVPDTLIACVFAATTGELGVMGWIKTTKERKKERNWQLEDEQRQREYMKEDMGNE